MVKKMDDCPQTHWNEIESAINKIQDDAVIWEFARIRAAKKERLRDKALVIWGRRVKLRDGHECVNCGSSERLHSHHIKFQSTHPSLKYDIDNGITLCLGCHADAHAGNTWLRAFMLGTRASKVVNNA